MTTRDFKKICIFSNSLATNCGRAEKLVGELKKRFPEAKLHTVEIGGREREETKEIVEKTAANFDGDTLVGIGGGDGTASVVIESMLMSRKLSRANRSAVLLPLWGGNANDLACMLNGLIGTTNLNRVMDRANAVKVHPLKLRFTPENSRPFTRLATCYASFGTTAQAGWLMESSSHIRNKKTWFSSSPGRVAAEALDVTRAFARVDPFRMFTPTSASEKSSGSTQKLYELILVNGPRFAKVEGLPVKLTDRAYFRASIDNKHFFMFYALKAYLGKSYGEVTNKPLDFTVKDNTWAQLDGEIFQLHAGTRVELNINSKSFLAISKRINTGEPDSGTIRKLAKYLKRTTESA